MPEPIKDEETETRTLSLCLFDVAGITVLNRCSNCPGAARGALNHRRCPREASQPNIFHREDPESKICAKLKSSASSSKLHEADTLHWNVALLSLGDSGGPARTFGRSKSDSDIRGSSTELSVNVLVPHVDGVLKRKAQLDADREAKHRKKVLSDELRPLSVLEWMDRKPPKPFHDFGFENLFMPGCWHVSPYSLTSTSAASPMDLQEDHPSGEAPYSRPFVPGCIIDTELDGCGVFACDDGVEADGCMLMGEFPL